MWRSYLTATLRHISRNPLGTFLNISGLALGFAAALLALLYVIHERTFDRFIPGHEGIYVVVPHHSIKGQGTRVGDRTSAYLASWLKSDFPSVQTTRLLPTELTVRRGQIAASEQTGWADPNLFSMLPLASVAGDLEAALRRPDGLVITRRMARKYFDRDSPLGESLDISGKPFQITAVIEDLPPATHLAPEIYGSALNREFGLQNYDEVPWPVDGNTPVMTYIRLPDGSGTSIEEMQRLMPGLAQRHMGRLFELMRSEYSVDLQLVQLSDLHLYPNDMQAMKPHGKPAIIAAAGIIGLLIVLVAVVNFVNLMTAHSARRAVEVGVRKVSGARRLDLMIQFMGESLLYACTAMAIALLLVDFTLPALATRLVPGLDGQWMIGNVLALAGGLSVLAGILGGVYPALVLSAHRPATVLKGNIQFTGSVRGRQCLVSLQFSVLIALVVATLVILGQTAFSLRDGLRFPQDQLLIVYTPCPTTFTEQLRSVPGVSGTACAAGDPTNFAPRSFTQATRPDGAHVNLGIGSVGFGLFELLGVQPVAGRLYDPARDAAAAASEHAPIAILNESAVRAMGFESPTAAIGQSVVSLQNQGGPPSEVIGVVPDFTFDLQGTRMGPIIYWAHAIHDGPGAVVNVKLAGQQVPETLGAIDALWRRIGEPGPVRRLFMEQLLQENYVATIRQAWIVSGLSILAIVIAAFGLFGLSALSAEQRTREIGVRKVMGATKHDILRLLLWQFTKPVLWANVIAWPVAFFAMRRWLGGFANHIEIQPWMFLTAAALAVAIALATVMGHALLVSRAKPVNALRHE
jgi:putative ABC transport system permease protein